METILQVGQKLRERKLSPVELTQECLRKIEQRNPVLNAFITVTQDAALAEARETEEQIRSGDWRGPLHGVPIALKDLIDTAGVRTTAACGLFKDRIPTTDAEIVAKLRRAGAILLGKQNLHECAYGGSSMISFYGEVHNPWNPAHITGGSSGGSAASVAAGLCWGAIGTDTAGSIREPAAQCGVVGLKPTYGRVSIRGIIPLSVSLDHAGPITRNVSDAAVMLQAIAGYDREDPYSANHPTEDYVACLSKGLSSLRVGIPRRFFFEDLDPEVAAAVEEAIEVLGKLGAKTKETTLDTPTDRTLQAGESYAYHAAFVARSPQLYQPETLRRLRSGENVTPQQIAVLRQDLQKQREKIEQVFQEVDVLVTPTTPIPPPEIAELKQNPDLLRPRELVLLRNTRPFNVWGLPAISVPCGFTRAGLPIGLQVAAPHWKEGLLLSVAHAYEQATEWHKRAPQS